MIVVCDFTQMLTSNKTLKLVSISAYIDIDISIINYA